MSIIDSDKEIDLEPSQGFELKPSQSHISDESLLKVMGRASDQLLDWQFEDGYWWFTLEANETIGAGFIQLMHFIKDVDLSIQNGIVNRLLQVQREDGSWGLYHGADGDLSTTVECYFALRLAGWSPDNPVLKKSKEFIRQNGGLTKIRIFSRIHLALFGLIDWVDCPAMPVEMILLPDWAPVSIYSFSSWARASIVPLLVLMAKKPILPISFDLEELYVEPPELRKWSFDIKEPISLEAGFVYIDKALKYLGGKIPLKPLRSKALSKAENWIWSHIQKTEDIYPALAYGLQAFHALGHRLDSSQIQKPLKALKSFQQNYLGELPNLPKKEAPLKEQARNHIIHQQCCISPVWDTPWSLTALLEAGFPKDDPELVKSGKWLLSKQITELKGDWSVKVPNVASGGWAFEFENDYFPDVDDTFQVLTVINQIDLPVRQKEKAIQRGLNWLLAMQNDDGGWGAFDKNNDLELVNKIPFADHGACLDPSSPDITGRALELFVKMGFSKDHPAIEKGVNYLLKSQEDFGGWFGRWGVNYIYGTWCALTGLHALELGGFREATYKAISWLKNIQHKDGGFSESPESYALGEYVPYQKSVASQTAWGAMGLIAAGFEKSKEAKAAINYLISGFNGFSWEEKQFTGTGFPGHFYIRYHGYRHYFPLLALARYRNAS